MSGGPQAPDSLSTGEWRAFERWALRQLGARPAGTAAGKGSSGGGGHDRGIDGFMPDDDRPVQIKYRHKLTVGALREFVAVLQREGQSRGVLVALSFSGTTRDEAASFRERGVDVELLTEPDIRGAKRAVAAPDDSGIPSLTELEGQIAETVGVDPADWTFADRARLSRLIRHHAAAERLWREVLALDPDRTIERDQLLATRRHELQAADRCEAAIMPLLSPAGACAPSRNAAPGRVARAESPSRTSRTSPSPAVVVGLSGLDISRT